MLCYFCEHSLSGVPNGTSKNVGLGKFWQDLEISEAFLISLEVSFLHGCIYFFESRNFLPKSLGLGFLTRISASRRVSDFTIRHPFYQSLVPYMGAGHKTQNRMTRLKRGSQTSDGQPYFVQTWISKNKKIKYRRENIVHL